MPFLGEKSVFSDALEAYGNNESAQNGNQISHSWKKMQYINQDINFGQGRNGKEPIRQKCWYDPLSNSHVSVRPDGCTFTITDVVTIVNVRDKHDHTLRD